MQKTQLFYDPIRLPEDFPLTIPSFSTPPEYAHIHDCFEIGCCYSGTGGVFQIGAKVYACNPGDVVFINEQEYHILNEATPRNSCWKFINLNPAALLAGYIAPEENFFDTAAFAGIGFQNVISADRAPELVQLVHILFAELEKPDEAATDPVELVRQLQAFCDCVALETCQCGGCPLEWLCEQIGKGRQLDEWELPEEG